MNTDSLIKRPIFLVINSQLFLLYNFSKFLYIFTLFIHPSTLNITNKTPHSPDDGSAEPKRYSVDWLCFSINPYFLFGLLVVNFSSQIVGLLSIIFFHIYIYIYNVKLASIVEGDLKVPISIATTPRCRGGHKSFPWIGLLYPWYIPNNAKY